MPREAQAPIEAVFIDLDGTLVDTAFLHTTAWCQALDEAGEPCPAAIVHRRLGLDAKELLQTLLGRFEPSIAERHDELVAERAHQVRALPGADDFLRSMQEAGIPVTVLTTGRPLELPAELGSLHSATAIGAVVGMYTPGVRPGSDLLAAALLRGAVEASHALVVTATTQGASEAAHHGVACIGVETGGLTRRELLAAGATEVCRDLQVVLSRFRAHRSLGVPFARRASVDVVIEIPRGTRNKYELDPAEGVLRLDRRLPSSLAYPADYGYVPGTLGEDGDPVDALVLLEEPTVPGTIVDAVPLGVVFMEDEHGSDPKLVTVLRERAESERLCDLEDLPFGVLAGLEHFFGVYKQLDAKRSSQTAGFGNRAQAWAELMAARRRATETSPS